MEECDKAYDELKAKQEGSAKAKNVLRGAGYARGGGVGRMKKHEDEAEDKKLIKKELKSAKIVAKKHGGPVEGKHAAKRADKYARGGSAPSGKHTHININLAASQADKEAAAKKGMMVGAQMAAQRMQGAPRPMGGAPMQARGPMPAPQAPGGAPGGGVPPTMQGGMKRGGKAYAKGGKVGPVKVKGVPHLEGGSGGALGRLEKAKQYGTKPKA